MHLHPSSSLLRHLPDPAQAFLLSHLLLHNLVIVVETDFGKSIDIETYWAMEGLVTWVRQIQNDLQNTRIVGSLWLALRVDHMAQIIPSPGGVTLLNMSALQHVALEVHANLKDG